jgi:hypothetical protein
MSIKYILENDSLKITQEKSRFMPKSILEDEIASLTRQIEKLTAKKEEYEAYLVKYEQLEIDNTEIVEAIVVDSK